MQSSRIVASALLMYWQRFDCGKEGAKIKVGGYQFVFGSRRRNINVISESGLVSPC